MVKKILAIILAIVLILALIGCVDSNNLNGTWISGNLTVTFSGNNYSVSASNFVVHPFPSNTGTFSIIGPNIHLANSRGHGFFSTFSRPENNVIIIDGRRFIRQR